MNNKAILLSLILFTTQAYAQAPEGTCAKAARIGEIVAISMERGASEESVISWVKDKPYSPIVDVIVHLVYSMGWTPKEAWSSVYLRCEMGDLLPSGFTIKGEK